MCFRMISRQKIRPKRCLNYLVRLKIQLNTNKSGKKDQNKS